MSTIAIDPVTPSTLYVGTGSGRFYTGGGSGVFKSIDSGGNWTAANTGLSNLDVNALAIDATSPSTIYAGSKGGGVFKSTDSGGTWAAANTGLTNLTVNALTINPSTASTIYAGTNGGVFRSIDAGATWAAFSNTGLPAGVSVTALGPAGMSTLYAGLSFGSVWQYTTPPAPLLFHTLTPCRAIDTRNATGPDAAAPALTGGGTRTMAIATRCGLPASAVALSVNITVIGPSAPGHLMLYAADVPRPTASSINFAAGQTRANNGILGLGATGAGFKVFNESAGSVELILDVNGWYE